MGVVVPLIVTREFKRPSDLPRTCNDENLVWAVREWMCGASELEIGRILRVPAREVRYWTRARGWMLVAAIIKEQIQEISHGQLSRLSSKTWLALEDRIDNGDPVTVTDKEGNATTSRRPLTGKVLADIAAIVVDRKEVVEKRMANIPDVEGNLPLQKLADALEGFYKLELEDRIRSRTLPPANQPLTIESSATVEMREALDAD